MMTSQQRHILIRLQPALRRAIIARYGPAMADDLVQDANVAIIERANKDPAYLVATGEAYILQLGVWRAGDAARHEWAYLRAVAIGEDEIEALEVWPDFATTVSIDQALADVKERTRIVALGIAGGMGTTDIAAVLDVQPQGIAYHKRRLREALEGVN